MQRFLSILTLVLTFTFLVVKTSAQIYYAKDYGVVPNTGENSANKLTKLVQNISEKGKKATVLLEKGRYDFYPEVLNQRQYYISNHDQVNPKNVGIVIENAKNITFIGHGSDFVFHSRMLPISIVNSKNITLNGIFIDFQEPHIAQAKIIENDTINKKITFKFEPWVKWRISDSVIYNVGQEWENKLTSAIAFEQNTKRLVYNTADLNIGKRHFIINSDSSITANWNDEKLIDGTVLAFRSWYRPAPAIFVTNSKNTTLKNITVHYSEGMGLLAQMSENIYLDNFNVSLKGHQDPRYFTTQADATHFSGCRGKIISVNGLYEGMMDDAINVHGTYLKIISKVNHNTVIARYMHSQAWGFEWGYKGDKVQFVSSNKMEIIGSINYISSIKPIDKTSVAGAKEFEITFKKPLTGIEFKESVGIENLTWTPSVLFENNLVRNNRARGTLFSTPKKTIVQKNTFDHTSGTAILLCGDCNEWFETGACKNVVIRQNLFVNSLTSMFQFTNAVISIYPEIPNLDGQQKFFHSNIKIYNNKFVTFDKPILYAKSVRNLLFRHNNIVKNDDYQQYHFIKSTFLFERTNNVKIKNNKFDFDFDANAEIVFK